MPDEYPWVEEAAPPSPVSTGGQPPVPDEDARLPLCTAPGIPRRRAAWSPDSRCVLCRFETALRVLPDTRSADGSPRGQDCDRVITALLFRVLERVYQDAAPYAPPGGKIPPSFPAGRSFQARTQPRTGE